MYRGHPDATVLFSSPVVSALGSESDDPGSSPGTHMQEKNASSTIYLLIHSCFFLVYNSQYSLLQSYPSRTLSFLSI